MSRILVVDDNRELAENVAEILEGEGFEVDIFEHPIAALEAVTPGKYAAALLDIRMPEMDGVELFKRLREIDPCLLALAMTAYSQDERIRAAVEAGILAVMPKPLDVPRLLGRLTSMADGEAALVVEDDVDQAQNLCEVLVERGFRPAPAHTVAEALRMAAVTEFHVVLADVRLPDGDGIDLVAELCRRQPRLLALVFSGYGLHEVDPNHRIERGGATFFEKPLDIPRLLRALGREAA